MKNIFTLALLLVLGIQAEKTNGISKEFHDIESVSIFPKVYDQAFPNPMKGFRSSSSKAEDFPTLTHLSVKWNEIENSESDGVEKILEYCNKQWADLPGKNVKVIPRVYLEWPYSRQNADNTRDAVTSDWGDKRYCDRYWPSDLRRGDYSSEQFKKRLVNLISKMGKAWDKDSRVAYIEMGLIGWWGEQHTPFINAETRQPVWKTTFKHIDIRTWLPGDDWDSMQMKYKVEPDKNLISGNFKLPENLPKGEYVIALSILDPSGNVPSVRFAIQNYFNGGRHPIGKM